MNHLVARLLALSIALFCAVGQASAASHGNGATAANATTAMGSGLNFATLDSATYANSSSINISSAFTISFWLQTTALNSTTSTYFVQQGVYPSSGFGVFDNGPYASSEEFGTYAGNNGTCGYTSGFACAARSLVNDGDRHLITSVWDGFFGGAIYVDGVLQETVGAGVVPYVPCACAGTIGAIQTNITMTDVRIYNVALTASQISQIYTLGQAGLVPALSNTLSANLAAYWPLSTSTIHLTAGVGTLTDISGNNNVASITDSTPTIAITAPTTNQSVSGSFTLTATATDVVSIASVQWSIDGASVGSPVTMSPFSYTWTSSAFPFIDGTHVVEAVATNAAGMVASATPLTFTTTNSVSAVVAYIDSVAGLDSNPCTISQPCQTTTKANTIATGESGQILIKGSQSITGCFSRTSSTNSATPLYPMTYGAYGTGKYTVVPNCTGENGAFQIASGANNVVIQDGIITGSGTTPRAGVIIQNATSTQQSGITVQRMTIGGIQYFAAVGDSGADILYESSEGTGGYSGLKFLNNTLCGTSSSSGDDQSIGGFANGTENNLNMTITGNVACNNSGSTGAFTPIGNGISLNGIGTALVNFNQISNNGGKANYCGGPVGLIGNNSSFLLWQFNESYNTTFLNINTAYPSGLCDDEGFDFDTSVSDSIGEYNYAHGNAASGYYHFIDGTTPTWGRNTFRYSISENDDAGGWRGFGMLGVAPYFSAASYFYNMTVYSNQTFSGSTYGNNLNIGAFGYVVGYPGNAYTGVSANNIIASNTPNGFSGVSAIYQADGTNNGATATFVDNLYWPNSGSGVNIKYQGTAYSSLSAFQSATSQDTGTSSSNPTFASPPYGALTWTPSTTSSWPPSAAPTPYSTIASAAQCNGLDLTQSPYSLSVGTRDYYANAIPGTMTGTHYNRGAYGGGC